MKFAHLTATEIVKKIRAKEFTAKAVTTAYLDRIKLLEPKIKAFNEVFDAQALKQAEAVVKINRIMGGKFLSKRLYYAPPSPDQIDEIRKYYGNIYPTVPSPKRARGRAKK